MNNLNIGDKTFDLKHKTILMGILNVTPDSFYDGGKYFSPDKAIKHALVMEKQGADIIDIGGESTRPGAKKISAKEEINRIVPTIEELVKKINIPISVDTYKSKVAKKTIDAGASMINDISALRGDKSLVKIVSEYEIPICLMHMKGNPGNMQNNPFYKDLIKEIFLFLKERTEFAVLNNIKKEKIIIDPGIGFGKRTGRGIEDNCEILRNLDKLKLLKFPIMVGASRKTFIGNVCGDDKSPIIKERLEGSLTAACIAVMNGANIIRAHDVKETRSCLNLIDCVIR
ncbi:MAG: dihydropteroate synthase [Candidatus Thermoplasmatota archaeon]|nr:dihydropteroate synthase [Candidatus Thermoplasmatota archaeon]